MSNDPKSQPPKTPTTGKGPGSGTGTGKSDLPTELPDFPAPTSGDSGDSGSTTGK